MRLLAQAKFGFPAPIVIADAGLLSRKNIEVLVSDGYEYILGARIKNEKETVKQRILSLNLREDQAASIKTDDDLRIVVSYTEKRRKKDAFNGAKGLQRLQTKVASRKVCATASKAISASVSAPTSCSSKWSDY